MNCRPVYVVAAITVLCRSAGYLVIAPQSTEAKVGDTTYFNCSTNLTSEEIFWYHDLNFIYIGEWIDPYRERFKIERTAPNLHVSHNLVIQSVKPSDAGEYICIDEDGAGTKRSAYLVVLEYDPDCQSNIHPDGVIGQNIFDIPPDEVHLTCNVTYHGNIPPQMEWRKVADNTSLTDNVTYNVTSNNHVVYTLKLKGDISLDKSSYICKTKRSTVTHRKCISETLNVLYFFDGRTIEQDVVRGEKVTCIANNNTFPCTNQWYIDNYDSCPLSCDATITTHVLGKYLCRLKCNIRGNDYFFDAMNATVIGARTSSPPSTSGGPTIAVAVVIPISIVLFALIAVFSIRHKKIKYERRMAQKEAYYKLRNERLLALKEAYYKKLQNEENEAELVFKIKKEDKAIRGVAILGRKLFVMHEKSSHFEIYDRDDFKVASKLLRVKDVVTAFDICSCKFNNCLYVMDEEDLHCNDKNKSEARKVVKISEDGRILGKWSTNACGFLSAAKERHVIITSRDNHKLLEYDSDGKLFRSIDLPDCNRPWHTIKLNENHYIVSHGTYENLNRVCIVDKNGIVINSFGGEMGSAENQLHIPYYLAVGHNDCVLVADFCNDRVLLLDSNLRFKTIIVPKFKQGFRNPRRIYLDEGLLVVVVGAGIPQNTLYVHVEPMDIANETETVSRLKEHDDTEKTIHTEDRDKEKETEEGIALQMIEEQKEISVVEGKNYSKETEERAGLVEKGNPKETHEDALCSGKEADEGDTVKVIKEHKETYEHTDESESDEELDDWWNKRTVKVDVLKRIEKDCTLLVFDIKRLLKNYSD